MHFLFPSVLYHRAVAYENAETFNTSQHHIWGNDGMMSLKLLASMNGRHPQYVPAVNGRDAYVSPSPIASESCTDLSRFGWCTESSEWRTIPFDAAELYMLQGLVQTPTETLMYYNGMPMPHGEVLFTAAEAEGLYGNNTGIGILRMRLNGFVAVRAEPQAYTPELSEMPSFVTVALLVPSPPSSCGGAGCELTLRLNFETGAAGLVAVELRLATTNQPVAAHALALAEKMYGNWLDRAARWSGMQALNQTTLAGREVMVAVVMQDASLYSLAFDYKRVTRKSDDEAVTVTFHKIPAFQAGNGGYVAHGVPSLLSFNNTLLAFCEGRQFSCADTPGQHDLLYQRSTDGGTEWQNCTDSVALVDVSQEFGKECAGAKTSCAIWEPTPVVEHSTGKIFVFFSLSPVNMLSTVGPACHISFTKTLLMIESSDLANSFGSIRNISAEVVLPTAKWGGSPGIFTGNPGVQLPSGRLVVHVPRDPQESECVPPRS